MARQRSAEELRVLREEFLVRANATFDHQQAGLPVFDQDGKNGLVTFTEREDRACEVTDALARWLLEEHLSLDQEADPGVQVDCPICGGPVRYDSPQQAELEIRGLKTRRGKIEYERTARRLYERLVCRGWAGQVKELIAALEDESARLGQPPPKASNNDPRRIVSLTLEYIKTNAHRMDYARYRREGLPITSAIVESLIKQFNQRVKGTEKFWTQDGAEAVLQIRAAYLSEDDRAERFHEQWPRGRAAGRNRQNLSA